MLYLFWGTLVIFVVMFVFSVLMPHRFARVLHGFEKFTSSKEDCMLYLL